MSKFGVRLAGTITAARYKLGRVVRRNARMTLQQAATRTVEIEPAGRSVATLPPIIDDASIGRIVLGYQQKPRDEVLRDIERPKHALGPVQAMFLKDAFLLADALYTPRVSVTLDERRSRLDYWRGENVARLDQAGLASTFSGSRWFGHLIHDEFPLLLELERWAKPVMHRRPAYAHEAGYRQELGLASPPAFDALQVRELVVFHDTFQSVNKTRHYHTLRSRLKRDGRGQKRVYLLRGNTGARRVLVNEAEVAERLSREGFVVINPSLQTVHEVLDACINAEMIVGVEGSHLTPAFLAAAPEAIVLGINPPRRVNAMLCELAPYFGLSGAMVVGDDVDAAGEDFRIDTATVLSAIERADGIRAREPHRAAAFLDRLGCPA